MIFYTMYNKDKADYPCVQVRRSEWDDMGYATAFELIYHTGLSSSVRLGLVKIARLGQGPGRTALPKEFPKLEEEYFSLGQSREFYERVYGLGFRIGWTILKALRDIRIDPKRIIRIKKEEVFQFSIARNLGALQTVKIPEFSSRRWIHAPDIPRGRSPGDIRFSEDLRIEFSCKIKGALRPVDCVFSFSGSEGLPWRSNVIVGKNGVGKTQFLANFIGAVTGIERAGTVSDDRIKISKVFAVSYNVFDKFFMPDDIRVPNSKRRTEYLSNSARYEYVGIRESNGNQQSYRILGSTSLSRKFVDAVQAIIDAGRYQQWLEVMSPILNESGLTLSGNSGDGKWAKSFRNMGAGHKVAISILTSLFSRLIEGSLVVMDEPENHLHPSLLSSTLHTLRGMLEVTNSYSIISTHSPIVIQETPSRCVRVLANTDGVARITMLNKESFGSSLDSLTSSVFGVHSNMPDYRGTIRKLADKGLSLDEVNGLFGRDLSSEAASLFLSSGGRP